MIRKTDKKILKDFEESYKCNVKIEDILSKTDYFVTSNDVQYYKHKQFKLKLKFAYSIVMTLILMTSIGTVGLLGYNSYLSRIDYTQSSNHTPYQLSDEEIEFMELHSDKNYFNSIFEILLEKNIYLNIFYGKTSNNENVYYYKLSTINIDEFDFIIYIDSIKININHHNNCSFGILKIISNNDQTELDVLEFSIIHNGIEKQFTLGAFANNSFN